ncbi:Pectinesterase inhibitor domain containing protein [Melia azedarach]|uniref:Pectinesterase inhibitor domain containing protein n=1 Tax=Melia azedarach TaxID=155640 RepID=A0ACC1WPS4_MELAZ|nr:Pectinesterase inhibitor domain containing protein [Melia azedarach]
MVLATLSFFFFLHSVASPISATTHQKVQSHLLQKACNRTHEYQNLCLKVLKSDPQTASASTPLALANGVLKMAMSDTIMASERIRVLLTSKYTKPAYKAAMEGCIYWYNVAAGDFNVSMRELNEDPPTANYDAMLAGTQTQYFQNALASDRVQVPEIVTLNIKLVFFSLVAGASIDIVELN